jgi:hypothetical protein
MDTIDFVNYLYNEMDKTSAIRKIDFDKMKHRELTANEIRQLMFPWIENYITNKEQKMKKINFRIRFDYKIFAIMFCFETFMIATTFCAFSIAESEFTRVQKWIMYMAMGVVFALCYSYSIEKRPTEKEKFRRACKFYRNGKCFRCNNGICNPLYFKKCDEESCGWMKLFEWWRKGDLYTVEEDKRKHPEYIKGDFIYCKNWIFQPWEIAVHKTTIEEYINNNIHTTNYYGID